MEKLLQARLDSLSICPACGTRRHIGSSARFQCGSSFTVSDTTGTIVASDPCPKLSDHMATMLTADVLGGKAGAA